MPTLYVPPTEFVTENPEASAALRDAAAAYVNARLAELGVSGPPRRTETRGAFRGLREYDWNAPREAILGSAFLLPAGPRQASEFARVVSLVWRADCLLAGASWESGTAPLRDTPPEIQRGGAPLSQQMARAPEGRSPIRWESSAVGVLAKRLSLLMDAVGGERLAAGGFVVNASLSRLACKWTPRPVDTPAERVRQPPAPSLAPTPPSTPLAGWPAVVPQASTRVLAFPKRPHRLVRAEILSSGAVNAWPLATAKVSVADGVFGVPKATLLGEQAAIQAATQADIQAQRRAQPSPFLPVALANSALQALTPKVHDVRETEFRILRRRGRWVYLNRGRAYGLEIGSHLMGPGGAKLHIVQFAPDEKGVEGVDVGIALVRTESLEAPLKEGDTLTFDTTEFPARSAPALETNPL